MEEKQEFEVELQQLVPQEKEGVMEIVTSWMEEGLEKGLVQGERKLVLQQLVWKLGDLDSAIVTRIEVLPHELVEKLGRALLSFVTHGDLDAWLQSHRL